MKKNDKISSLEFIIRKTMISISSIVKNTNQYFITKLDDFLNPKNKYDEPLPDLIGYILMSPSGIVRIEPKKALEISVEHFKNRVYNIVTKQSYKK